LQTLSGIAAGSLALALYFSRSDSVAWTGIFCFNSTDGCGFPASTTSTIIIGELGV